VIPVAFRLDDPSATSNHALERAIIERLAYHRVPATFAVIPFREAEGSVVGMTGADAAHLIEAVNAGIIEIAVHGYAHRVRGRTGDGNWTEFAGLSAGRQRTDLEAARRQLETVFGRRVAGFVPPWNSFDSDTVAALEDLDFDYLSAGWDAPPTPSARIPVLPHTCNLAHLRTAVAEARCYAPLPSLVLVILHHFDFIESGQADAVLSLDQLDKALAWVSGQADLEPVTVSGLGQRIMPSECQRGLSRYRLGSALHWRVQAMLPRYSLVCGGWWGILARSLACRTRRFAQRNPAHDRVTWT
jgi:hypothetical protein